MTNNEHASIMHPFSPCHENQALTLFTVFLIGIKMNHDQNHLSTLLLSIFYLKLLCTKDGFKNVV